MAKILRKLLLGTLLFLGCLYVSYRTPIKISYADDVSNKDIIKYEIPAMVSYYAAKYKVNPKLANYIANNESNYNPLEVGDMNIICHDKSSRGYGKPVRARGIFQLTDCYYPNVSDEQAFNPEFNIDYGMQIIAKGKETCKEQFTTCRWYYGRM